MAQTQTNTPTPVYYADELRDVASLIDLVVDGGEIDELSAAMLGDALDKIIECANYMDRRVDA